MKKWVWVVSIFCAVCCGAFAGLNDGLIAHYPFDGHCQDVSGNGHHGNLVSGSFGSDALGRPASALELDGISDHAVVPDSQDLRLSNTDYTLSAWLCLYSYSTDNGSQILAKRETYSNAGWTLGVSGSKVGVSGKAALVVSGGGDPQLKSYDIVPLDTWCLITTTYSKNNNVSTMYIDGQYNGSSTFVHQPNGNIDCSMFIGMDSFLPEKYWLHGKIDDLRIYNRALSQSEISELYNQGVPSLNQGLVAYYPFDGDAKDYSGNGNDADVHGSPSFADNYLKLYDNTSNYLSLPNSLIDERTEFSVSAKVRIDKIEDINPLLSGANGSDANEFSIVYLYSHPNIQTKQWLQNNGSGHYHLSYNRSVEDLEWHYISYTYDGSTISFYLDGELQEITSSTEPSWQIDPGGLIVGQEQDSVGGGFAGNQNWTGAIDELRFYNRALSASEVVQLYTQEKQLDYITISGTNTVAEGSLTPYTCIAHFTDGSQADVSESAKWSVVDTSSSSYMQGKYLRADNVDEEVPVEINAKYTHGNATKQSEPPYEVSIHPSLEVVIGAVSTFNEPQSRFDVQLFATSYTENEPITSYKWDLDGD